MNDIVQGNFRSFPSSEEILEDILVLNDFINLYRTEPRTIWFKGKEGRELNGEHAFQIAIMAGAANSRGKLGLDNERILMRALTHDLVEVYAKDTPMFPDVFRGEAYQPNSADKREREEKAYERIAEELKRFPYIVASVRAYLDQSDEESRFVSAFEKLIAVMNIYQDDGRAWRMLGVPIEEADRRHRERASKHPAVKDWYDVLLKMVWADAEKRPNFYPVMPKPVERARRSE